MPRTKLDPTAYEAQLREVTAVVGEVHGVAHLGCLSKVSMKEKELVIVEMRERKRT